MVVDFVAGVLGPGGLDDVDIFSTNRLLDFATRFSNRELGQNTVARRYSEDIADVMNELGVGVAPKDNQIADHLFVGIKDGRRCGVGG